MKKIIILLLLFCSFNQAGPAKRHSLEHELIATTQLKQAVIPYHPRAQKSEEKIANIPLLKTKDEKDDKKEVHAARTVAKHVAVGTATAILTTTAGALTVAGSAELVSAGPDSSQVGSDITPSEIEIALDDVSNFAPAMPSLPQTDDDGDGE